MMESKVGWNNKISFDSEDIMERTFFFTTSEGNLICKTGNSLTNKMKNKFIIVDNKISCRFPKSCFIEVIEAIEKENCFIVTSANLINSQELDFTPKAWKDLVLDIKDIIVDGTLELYSAKTNVGNCNSVVIKYQYSDPFEEDDKIYFRSAIYDGDIIYNTVFLMATESFSKDLSLMYFHDFKKLA